AELALFADRGDQAAASSLAFRIKRLEGEFLLSHLTARAWLPAHGFPTDLLTFIPETLTDVAARKRPKDAAHDGTAELNRDDDVAGTRDFPTRNLAIAIAEYSPGAGVVIGGRVHASAGVT